MKKLIIFFLIMSSSAHALLPIEGIVYGRVDNIKQFDPFRGILRPNYIETQVGELEGQMSHYFALYQQGQDLKSFCEKGQRLEYTNKSKEEIALRSIVANMQYVGLDYSLRSIANYMKILEYSEIEYINLYKNLVANSCSQNLTIFSHKMLLANFKHFWTHDTGLKLPSIKGNNYFSLNAQKRMNTRDVIKRELYYTLNSFRSMCSWNSDTSNFALLTPYLKNPYLMSFVFNNMQNRKVALDPKTGSAFYTKSQASIQVVCENLVCRRKEESVFLKKFPVLSGSRGIEDNLKLLYCSKLQNHRVYNRDLARHQKAWLRGRDYNSQIIETMNLLAQITGVSDMLMSVDKLKDVSTILKKNIREHWDKWANKNSDKFNSEQLYEESLEVSIVSQSLSNKVKLGEFGVELKVELGEIDKLLGDYDKIDATFYLDFPISLIETLKQQLVYSYNSSRYKEVARLRAEFIKSINVQLAKKKKYFKVPIWNDRMGDILADELIDQFLEQKQKPNLRFSKITKKIPVTFHFGVYALQYIRDKFKSNSFGAKKAVIGSFK